METSPNYTAPAGRFESQSPDLDQMLTARAVARRYGISTRTLDRWLIKPHLAFPKPDFTTQDISGRVASRHWRIARLVEWEKTQAMRNAAASTNP